MVTLIDLDAEYAKFIWALLVNLSGEPQILHRTFWILVRHFTVKCPVNIKVFAGHLFARHCPWFSLTGQNVQRDQTPLRDIFKICPTYSAIRQISRTLPDGIINLEVNQCVDGWVVTISKEPCWLQSTSTSILANYFSYLCCEISWAEHDKTISC